MKDFCIELTRSQKTSNEKLNIMREYLQAYILRILHDQGLFQTTAFLGGTALRFLYDLPRFSEDLDFSQMRKPKYSFDGFIKNIHQELTLAGYNASLSVKEEKTVQHAFIRFESLLKDVGLTTNQKQKFSVKIKIDTNPPAGGVLATKIVNKYFPIAFLTFDLASLFAGKCSALLGRKYTKGRDFYDLAWYLSRFANLEPNIVLLCNGLKQGGWDGTMPTQKTWREFLYRIVSKADWKTVYADVFPFLENPKDMDIFTRENILSLIQGKDRR